MSKTAIYRNMKNPQDKMSNEILDETVKQANLNSPFLDPYFNAHLKKCDTISCIWELALLNQLRGADFTIKKHAKFDFEIDCDVHPVVIEATAPEITTNPGYSDNEKISQIEVRLIKTIKNKLKDFKESGEKKPFIIAISCSKINIFRIPNHHRDYLANRILEVIQLHPLISGVILSWDWPYYFPEIAIKHIGAIIDKPNDFFLIKNPNPSYVLPNRFEICCDKVFERP